MYQKFKKRILYAPLLTCALVLSYSQAHSQEATIDVDDKIDELDRKILDLELLKKDLIGLKNNLKQKEETIRNKENKLDEEMRSINSLRNSMAVRESEPFSKWHLAGYADVGFESISGDTNDSFLAGKFNPSFHFQFKDWIMFESELEIETSNDGETELALEYSQLNFLVHDNVTIVAGKFLSPIGQFQERLHPSWINRSINGPAGFGHGGVQPTSDVGIMLRGGVSTSEDLIFTYSLAAGNGPRFGHDEDELELEGFGRDNDSNKSFGGRVALVHSSSLEFGFSYLNAGLNAEEELLEDGDLEPAKNADYRLWGADLAYSKGPWDIRAEYLNSKTTPTGMALEEEVEEEEGHGGAEPVNWKTWYAQIAYRLSEITDHPILAKIEPVVRYGQFRVRVEDTLISNSENRWNFGVNYWAAPTIVIKAGIERRNYILPERTDETRYLMQLAYGF